MEREKTKIAHRCGHKKTYRVKPGKVAGVQAAYPTMSCRKCQQARFAANAATVFGG